MNLDSRIFIAGHRGLVGSALVRRLEANGYRNVLVRPRAELNLFERTEVFRFFESYRPEYIVLAAAKVGGILANQNFPADFIRDNLAIEMNIIEACHRFQTKRMLFMGSSCIYPKFAPQPIREEYMLSGALEPTNRPYAMAKLAGIEMCWSFNRQYGTRFLAAMPCNLYGPGDNFDLQSSHVLPALVRKAVEAKHSGHPKLIVWGTGTPRREFLFSDDLAEACIHLLNLSDETFDSLLKPDFPPLINVGTGTDISIRELAELVCEVAGYHGRLEFDHSYPDGTPRKVLDVSRMGGLGWRPRTPLRDGIEIMCASASCLLKDG